MTKKKSSDFWFLEARHVDLYKFITIKLRYLSFWPNGRWRRAAVTDNWIIAHVRSGFMS